MSEKKIVQLMSAQDPSVNTIIDDAFETRFVVRASAEDKDKDDIIIYLSSAKGCAQACRMCWLTQTGQTDETPATLEDFVFQARKSFEAAASYVNTSGRAVASIHYNFMARGEPMLNPLIRTDFDSLAQELVKEATVFLDTIDPSGEYESSAVKFKISTIMAGIWERDEHGTPIGGLNKLPFKVFKPEIYYSIYSMDPGFRKRWLPKAEAPEEALRLLAAYKRDGGWVRFHSAFIYAHNDEIKDIHEVIKAINFFNLPKIFNIVRYNSPDLNKSQEAPEEHLEDIRKYLELKGFEVQMVDRVGTDVFASCGTFVNTLGE